MPGIGFCCFCQRAIRVPYSDHFLGCDEYKQEHFRMADMKIRRKSVLYPKTEEEKQKLRSGTKTNP